jgi:beta-lactamase regulating signal transducer with metallopeptidase domain
VSVPVDGSFLVPFTYELTVTLFLRATIILLLTASALLCHRRLSSSKRAAIWSAGLAVLILLPVLEVTLPAWRIQRHRFLGPSSPSGTETLITTGRTAPVAATTGEQDLFAIGHDDHRRPISAGEGLSLVVLLVWLVGTVLLLFRLLLHSLWAGQLARRGAATVDPGLHALALDLAERTGLTRGVEVVSSSRIGIPFSWGIRRPVIVFPEAARGWDLDQRRSVFLHEFAHIARHDHLVHLVVEIVRALYWMNPIVWFAARRNAIERERACDDFALLNGSRSENYAAHLLSLARSQMGVRAPTLTATMAGRSGLFERVRSIMDERQDRTPMKARHYLLSVPLTLLLVVPFATFDLTGSQPTIPTVSQCLEDLRSHTDPILRRQAAWWLGEHEDPAGVEQLVASLEDEVTGVRLVAAWALGEIKDRRSIEPLVGATGDRDPFVREMAVLSLGEIEDPSALVTLERLLDRDKALRYPVIWALGEIAGTDARRARDHAFDLLHEPVRENREVWTGDLDELLVEAVRPPPDDISTLIEGLRDRDAERRQQAALGLGLYGIRCHPRVMWAVNPLLDALRDPVPEVRAMAVWSLDEINPSRWGRKDH